MDITFQFHTFFVGREMSSLSRKNSMKQLIATLEALSYHQLQ